MPKTSVDEKPPWQLSTASLFEIVPLWRVATVHTHELCGIQALCLVPLLRAIAQGLTLFQQEFNRGAMRFVSRRAFLNQVGIVSAASFMPLGASGAGRKNWRAAIIGATGHGDYGHALDTAFEGVEGVQVVAVADPNPAGRARAAERSKALQQYADYRQMLAREKPGLVVIAPRWSEQHFAMAMAALENGAHVLTEKPFTVSLAESDKLLSFANRKNLKISVAHQMRLAPNIVHLRRAFADGFIGELLQIRAWGKQDSRAGGEDMLVLGTHIFDMMRLFAGEAISCTSQVFARSRPITREDAVNATEGIGPVAGDEIEGQFQFERGVTASFASRGRLRETLGPWAVELWCSKGAVRILMDIDPIVLQRRRQAPSPLSVVDEWTHLPGDPTITLSADQRGFGPANN
jgi:predicted dehydrogenase